MRRKLRSDQSAEESVCRDQPSVDFQYRYELRTNLLIGFRVRIVSTPIIHRDYQRQEQQMPSANVTKNIAICIVHCFSDVNMKTRSIFAVDVLYLINESEIVRYAVQGRLN